MHNISGLSRRTRLYATAAALSACAFPFAAHAQTAPVSDAPGRVAQADAATVEEVIVTGSRIRTRRLDAPAPVAAFDSELLVEATGSISVGDELSDLPQFSATNNQAASAGISSDSQVGLNLLDLRGLGTSRTLVLVNGRRHVSSSQLSAQPDTNTGPSGLIERVEVLTGGASAVYGADAIAGVVNFVLKDDYEGFQANFRAGVSGEGDAETQSFNATFGRNFHEGRGNVAADLEFAKVEALFNRDRDFAARQTGFAPDFSPGAPYRYRLIDDLRLASTSTGGTVVAPGRGVFRFAPDGTLNPADFGRGNLIPGAFVISEGGDGLNSVEDQTLLPSLERLGLNVLARYDVTETARLFFEGKAVRLESGATSQPAGATLSTAVDNPFLSQQARAALTGVLPAGATRFSFTRLNRDLGTPEVVNERLTLRGVVGLEGELTDNIRYEVSYNFGRTETDTTFFNNVITPRLQLAADAVIDANGVLGAAGGAVCRSTLLAAGASGNPDVDGCVATNFFGDGAVGQAARDYLTFTSRAEGVLTQHVLGGYLSGDTTEVFSLPGGPVAFVLGAEHRKESTAFRPDPADLVPGRTFRSGIQPIDGELEVLEGYAELSAPILVDLPFAKLLRVDGAVRVADYDLSGVGAKTSWGAGGVYAPSSKIRFRGSYQESVRAPNLAELFAPVSPVNFSVFDPCDATNLAGGPPQRTANCRALGVPEGFRASTIGGQVPGTTGGNPELGVESATTWTAGAVFVPLPNLSVALDYYEIELEDAIRTTTASTLLRLCADSPAFPNPFCDRVRRDPTTSDVTFVEEGATNIARLTTRGLDLDVRYAFDLGPGRTTLQAVASHVLERRDYLDPSAPDRATEILGNVGTPETRVNVNARYATERLELTYNLRYFSEAVRAFAGNRLVAGDAAPDVLETDDSFIHDVAVRLSATDRLSVILGIDNVLEADLPPGIYGAGFGGANYDAVGRFFYASVRVSL